MNRIRQQTVGSHLLTATAYDADGVEATVTDPVTVSILDGAGTQVDSGTASVSGSTLSYQVAAADLPALDTYEAVWSGTIDGIAQEWRTPFELVGGHLFEISDLRAHDGGTFASSVDYPTARLRDARVWVEERFEHPKAAGVAFVPRGRRERLRGTGTYALMASWPRVRRIVSVTVDGTALTAGEIAALEIHDRRIESESVWTAGAMIDIHYEHGYDYPPSPVVQAGLIAAKQYLLEKALSSRATTEATDVGFFRLSIAAPGGRLGIPEVDAVIADFTESAAWIG